MTGRKRETMKTIIIIGIIFCVYKIISKLSAESKERKQEEERQRIHEEQAAIRAEQARQREEIKAQIERNKLEVKERIEAEKRRIEWQKRQDEINRKAEAERIRLAKEQERQAAILERHEAEIRKAQFTASQALADIDFQKDRLADLESQLDYLLLLQAGTIPGSKEHDKYQKRIVTLHNQIHTAESKLNKAKFYHSEAQRKLA